MILPLSESPFLLLFLATWCATQPMRTASILIALCCIVCPPSACLTPISPSHSSSSPHLTPARQPTTYRHTYPTYASTSISANIPASTNPSLPTTIIVAAHPISETIEAPSSLRVEPEKWWWKASPTTAVSDWRWGLLVRMRVRGGGGGALEVIRLEGWEKTARAGLGVFGFGGVEDWFGFVLDLVWDRWLQAWVWDEAWISG